MNTTEKLIYSDPYAKTCDAKVINYGSGSRNTRSGLIVDKSIFYPGGGGQPNDTGRLIWGEESSNSIVDVEESPDSDYIVLFLPEDASLPTIGDKIKQEIDWPRRYKHMKIHTALHLLSVAIPLPVTSGAITEEKGRLDFDMPDPIEDREGLEAKLNELASQNLTVSEEWVSVEELEKRPNLVKTAYVKPPAVRDQVRLIKIGSEGDLIDIQACGGTHVANTSEISRIQLGKIEKKGRHNRRVNIFVE